MFTWNEMVGLYLLEKLGGSTDIAIYLMGHVKKGRRDFLEEEAREWHTSLRINQEDRWKRVSELSMKRKFHKMNASVPITCTLPFDGGMWRNSQIMLRMIRFIRGTFIRKHRVNEEGLSEEVECLYKDKIIVVNKIYQDFYNKNCIWRLDKDAEEALNDHLLFLEEDEQSPNYVPHEYMPYISLKDVDSPNIRLELVN